jgi:hypothetical protein
MEKIVRIAGEGVLDLQEGSAVSELDGVRKEENGGVLNAVVIGAVRNGAVELSIMEVEGDA